VSLDLSGMKLPDEPSQETSATVGSLCGAWAFLEIVTEQAIWGILKLDNKVGPHVTWRLDMKMRWELLLRVSKEHLPEEEPFLRKLNKQVKDCTRDRNIIVHGVVHALLESGDPNKPKAFWSVFRGADANKKFPVSIKAVQIVRDNVQKLGNEMKAFNGRHNFPQTSLDGGFGEEGWPKPLE
jgi:hypothetical protein